MANIRKRPSGSWQATVYVGTVDGKKHYEYITRATKQECKAAAAELEAEVGQGRYKITTDMTLYKAVDEYISSVSGVLSPTTIYTYRGYMKKALVPLLDYSLKSLTSDILQSHYAELLKTLAPKTIKNIHTFLSTVLDRYMGNKNPCKGVKLPKKVKFLSTTLSNSQIKTLSEKIKGQWLEIPVLLALWCGMRRGEILGLRWMDVDFENGFVYVRQTKVFAEGKSYIKSPKSYSGTRRIYLPIHLSNKLKDLFKTKTRKAIFKLEDLIFPDATPYISNAFHDFMKENDLPQIRFHDLRHMYATLMMSIGIPDLYTSITLGHGDKDITKIYQHIRGEET